PYWSKARTLTLKEPPAVWVPIAAPLVSVTLKWSSAAADRESTRLNSSDSLTTYAACCSTTISARPDWVRVTACEARTPLLKAALWTQPAEQLRVELPSPGPSLSPYTTLFRSPYWSKARTLTLKEPPAVWVPIAAPLVSVTLKWSSPA